MFSPPFLFDLLSPLSQVDGGFFNMTDAPLMADFSEVAKLVEPLMSYNPFWIRSVVLVILRDVNRGASVGPGEGERRGSWTHGRRGQHIVTPD